MSAKVSKGQAFEERIERLQEIVGSLEQGQVTLEDSLKIYKEGLDHVKNCREDIDKARHEIKVLTKGQWADFLQDEVDGVEVDDVEDDDVKGDDVKGEDNAHV